MGGSSTCSTIFLTATIWVGKPGVTIVGDDYMCEGGLKGIADINYNGADDQMQGISNISWSFTGPLTNFTSSYDHAQYKPGSTSGVGVITSSLTGTCGTAQADMPYQVVSCVQGGGDTELKVSPNPISGITNIEVIGGNLSNTETYQIIVYNRFGEILLTKEIIGSKGEIDLGQAKPDIYFIEARADGLHFREKVLKIR